MQVYFNASTSRKREIKPQNTGSTVGVGGLIINDLELRGRDLLFCPKLEFLTGNNQAKLNVENIKLLCNRRDSINKLSWKGIQNLNSAQKRPVALKHGWCSSAPRGEGLAVLCAPKSFRKWV